MYGRDSDLKALASEEEYRQLLANRINHDAIDIEPKDVDSIGQLNMAKAASELPQYGTSEMLSSFPSTTCVSSSIEHSCLEYTDTEAYSDCS